MEGVDLEAKKRLWASRHALPLVQGVYIIWVTDGLGMQCAYVGLSKDIRSRLNSHYKQAEEGSHPNPTLAELLKSTETEFSIIWSTESDWDTGGNYEAATVERWACKEIDSWWSVHLLNIEPAGNIGGRGYQSVPVFAQHILDGKRKKFGSIKACAEQLDASPKKVVEAVLKESPIQNWRLTIKDDTWWERQQHKREKKHHFEQNTSVDPNTDNLLKGIAIFLFFLCLFAC